MSKRTWCLATALQTGVVVLVVLLVSAQLGAAAPGAAPVGQGVPANVSSQAAPLPTFQPSITRQEARVIIDAAIEKARELRGTMAIAILDSGGNLVSFDRMDGRGPTWDTFAIGKAMGSLSTRRPTRDFPDLIQERPDRYFGTLGTMGARVYMVNGGQPLVVDGNIVGAAGVAGLGPGEDDQTIDAGVEAWQRLRQSMSR